MTSDQVLAEEEAILTWAFDAQLDDPQPSRTVERAGLDVVQADAAAAVAGHDRLVVIVGPAGAGKTTMLRAAVTDLDRHDRPVFGIAPTAKAARVLGDETGMHADTVAKLLHEWDQPDGPDPQWRLPRSTTVIVDEAGMLSTPDLYRLTQLATSQQWRLTLVGDHRQLQAVGRGGLFAELCTTTRAVELERIHRFANDWEAAASLRLRHGDIRALDIYEAHDRIFPGGIDEHCESIADDWMRWHDAGETVAITTATNDHVDAINHTIQQRRVDTGQLDPTAVATIADGHAVVGDVVATRRNQRQLHTTAGDTVRNRELWTVTAISDTGDLTAVDVAGTASVTLPADYAREHVRLGYAATEYGTQSGTETGSVTLATPATTGRGLYVAITRGQQDNRVYVVTDTHDIAEARDVLEAIVASDRADIPATTQRRQLAAQDRQPPPLQPRCQIPDWFHELRDEAVADYRAARQALDDSTVIRQRLLDAVAVAEQHIAVANRLCGPFDGECDAARDAVKQAEAAQRDAQHQLDTSALRGRRPARNQLAGANEAVTNTRQLLTAAQAKAHGPHSLRAVARGEIDSARTELRTHDMYDKWRYLPEHLQAAGDHLDALDTWHDWATGKPIDDELVAAVRSLNQYATHQPDDGTQLLAGATYRWAAERGIEFRPPPQPAIKPTGIELDL